MGELTRFYTDIRQILEQARSKTRSAVNSAMVEAYWQIGRGFSYANLYNCRQFYLKFPEQDILYTLCRELSWSHLRLIMRLDQAEAIEYYCDETRSSNWTVHQLERNIKSQNYQRLLYSSGELLDLLHQFFGKGDELLGQLRKELG